MATDKTENVTRGNLYGYDPLDLCIVGGAVLDGDQRGPLDTEIDNTDPLYDERVEEPLGEEFVLNVDAYGVITPIKIVKRDGVPCVVAGRQRVRAARVVNARRRKRGEPGIRVEATLTRSSNDNRLMGAMISENEVRRDDSPAVRIEKMRRFLDRGVVIEDVAITFGMSVSTAKQLMIYDDNAIDAVKRAVDSGKLSQSAAAEVARLKDPDKQRAALDKLMSSPGAATSTRAAKAAAKEVKRPGESVGVTDKRTKRELLDAVRATAHPNASEKTLAWWDGVEAALVLVLGDGGADKRLVAILDEVRKEQRK